MSRVRMAMIGGGPGAFIGPVHRIAAELDGEIELVAGAFSSDPDKSRAAGARYNLDPARAYASFDELIAAEARRPDGAAFVAIVTPNHLHFPAAKAALEAGLAVISDKPMTAGVEEARALAEVVARTKRLYGLTYTYTGYPLVREARAIVASGALGPLRKIVVEYSQGWLGQAIERDNKQAAWRTDPSQAGLGGCIGDIGVHAFNLAEFVGGVRVSEFCADLAAVVPGRALDDDCNMLLRFAGGARGVLHASQIATGERNNLNLRLYGEAGALIWRQEAPNELHLIAADGRRETRYTGAGHVGPAGALAARLPAGHPEGYLEAFANLYRDFAHALREQRPITDTLVPGVGEGVRGMEFVAQAVAASAKRAGWTTFEA